jgi:sarcosine oxidase
LTRRADVVVIGAGAMGSATAWWLARRGRHVVVLERFEHLHQRGSSHGGSRIFRFAYPDVEWVRMAQAALPLWREVEAATGATLLDTTGGIDHGAAFAVGAVGDALAAAGASHDWLEPEAATERWPGMRFDGRVLFQPDAGRCRADDTVRALALGAGQAGAEVYYEQGVEELSVDGDEAVVRTGFDEYRAPVAVVAAGPWTAALLRDLVPLPPLTVTKEQVFHFLATNDETQWPSYIHHQTPYRYGLETPDEGVKVAEHHGGRVVDPDQRDFEIDVEGEAAVVRYVEQWLPGLDPMPVTAATCLYTTTPDERFVVERHGPLVVVSACSGHGFKFTPLIGRMAADLALG